MAPDEYQWYVKLVQDRHQYLSLTYEQAEKIYRFEQDKDIYSNKHFFSFWEERDYELATFSEILNDEQLRIYKTFFKKGIEGYERSLIELDTKKANEIAYNEELLNFYETQFFPEFFKDPFHLLHFGSFYNEKSKIEFLKAEYKRFLNDTKREILTSHFRHSRTFQPNELKVSLLRHKLSCVLPSYISFKQQMDEPTKAVTYYLKQKLRYLPDKTEELLKRKFKESKEFNKINRQKHFGKIKGWLVIAEHLTVEEEKERRRMTFLLFDKERYGC